MWGKNGDNENTIREAICWFAAGVSVGTTLAILFAPHSGKETRAAIAEGATHLRERADDMAHHAFKAAEDMMHRAFHAAENGQEQMQEAAMAMGDKVQRAKDRMSSQSGV